VHSWHTDITYLPLENGEFLYLATVLDCFSRKVVGWSIAGHMRTGLVADALRMAAHTRGSLDGAVFHSDHGAQYVSRAFADLCTELGVTRSMGAIGTSADNAARNNTRALGVFKQAVLVLRWFVDGTRLTQLARDNSISTELTSILHEGPSACWRILVDLGDVGSLPARISQSG
jgi:transposase InsO family protein